MTGVPLEWDGKSAEVPRLRLPVQVVETVGSRAGRPGPRGWKQSDSAGPDAAQRNLRCWRRLTWRLASGCSIGSRAREGAAILAVPTGRPAREPQRPAPGRCVDVSSAGSRSAPAPLRAA